MNKEPPPVEDGRELRRGWTTGACAAAAAKAAAAALTTGSFPDPVEISLPGGQRPGFALARFEMNGQQATAAIVKDAGDDPDVTHGALVVATLRRGEAGRIVFHAGEGVGTVTRPGLALAPGEPAINPAPRQMIREALAEVSGAHAGWEVTIGIPGGARLAEKTLNGRLGILGGLSILGTTGIVIPFSCSAWIHSIYRGIDVARACGLSHVAGATGSASERAVQTLHGLPEPALIDMGDFVGGMLKYLRSHPVARVTVAGGAAKITKLAQGMLDVHSRQGAADMEALAGLAAGLGADAALRESIARANTVAQAFTLAGGAGLPLGRAVAEKAWQTAAPVLAGAPVALDIAVFDRDGLLLGLTPPRPVHDAPRPLKRR